jgi:hypothetical protein
MNDYITKFEEMVEQCNKVGLLLPDKLEATLLQLGANLNTQDTNNIAASVDMASNDPGLANKMKLALRKVGIKKETKETKDEIKTEVLLTDYDEQEDEMVMTDEVVLYGEATGYQNFQASPQTAYQTGTRRFQR